MPHVLLLIQTLKTTTSVILIIASLIFILSIRDLLEFCDIFLSNIIIAHANLPFVSICLLFQDIDFVFLCMYPLHYPLPISHYNQKSHLEFVYKFSHSVSCSSVILSSSQANDITFFVINVPSNSIVAGQLSHYHHYTPCFISIKQTALLLH